MSTLHGSECWLSGGVEVRSSGIAGKGLFASTDLAPGTVVSRLGGRTVSDATLRKMMRAAPDVYVDTVSVFADGNLVLPPGTTNHFGNHGCEPNLWWVDPFSLATRSRVAAGTELTVDYGTLTDDPGSRMVCGCMAGACRGVVTGLDWQRLDLQTVYGDHWVPVLRDRIRDSRSGLQRASPLGAGPTHLR